MCAALPNAGAPSTSPSLLYSHFGSALTNGLGPSEEGAAAAPAPAISEQVADMAAGWSQLLASGPGSGSIAAFGMAGIAASILVAACPRCGMDPTRNYLLSCALLKASLKLQAHIMSKRVVSSFLLD